MNLELTKKAQIAS